MSEPYFVQVQENGCGHCGAGRMWTIITPDGCEWSQSWSADEDGDCPNDAHEMCSDLNSAFYMGQERQTKELVDRFLAWPLPRDFGPDAGIAFTPSTHPHGWPTGTNLFTADQARAMLNYLFDRDVQPGGG